MPISPDAKRIANKLYALYGTDSGVLFGIINNRTGIECIVQATIEIFMNGGEKKMEMKEVKERMSEIRDYLNKATGKIVNLEKDLDTEFIVRPQGGLRKGVK